MAKVNIPSEFLTSEDVARFLRCSIKTVYDYRRHGKIKSYHRASKRGRLLFRREEVEKLMIPDERKTGMPLGISLDEAIRWIANEIPVDYDVTQDSVYNMKGRESDAPTDLSLSLEEYLYGGEAICQK